MAQPCNKEVVPITAPIAIRCDDCNQLHPYEPEPWPHGPIYLTEHGAYTEAEYHRVFGK